jgi:hypothetical protein
MENIYIVSYSTGEYEDYRECNIFATFDEQKAIAYVRRFNSLIDKWYNYYSKYNGDYRWIKDEFVEKYFNRWYIMHELNDCSYKEIEVRN